MALVLPNAVGAALAWVNTDDLVAAAGFEAPAAAGDGETKIGTDFVTHAFAAVIDTDDRPGLEGSKGRASRAVRGGWYGDSHEAVQQVERCMMVGARTLLAGPRIEGDAIFGWFWGGALDIFNLIVRVRFLFPARSVIEGLHVDAVPVNELIRDVKACPRCRDGFGGRCHWGSLDIGGQGHEERRGRDHCN